MSSKSVPVATIVGINIPSLSSGPDFYQSDFAHEKSSSEDYMSNIYVFCGPEYNANLLSEIITVTSSSLNYYVRLGGGGSADMVRHEPHYAAPLQRIEDRLEKYYLDQALTIESSKTGRVDATFSSFFLPVTYRAAGNRDLARAEKRLRDLSEMTKGLPQEQLHSFETIREAGITIRKFSEALPVSRLPLIGLDQDGTVVMTFTPDDHKAFGSLSVYGDGTFAYYIEGEGGIISDGDAKIDAPLPDALKELLAG